MARVTVTPAATSTDGAVVVPTEFIVDGIAIANNGRRVVRIVNGSVGSINVTEQVNATVDGNIVPDKVVALAAAGVAYFGPWSSIYEQEDGAVWIDVSAFADVDYEVIELPAR